jgi:protein-S-isoprenylcysteine O-methyltransferase Ste14
MSWWQQVRAIALLPGNVTIVVPVLILVFGEGPNVGWGLGGVPAVLVSLLGAAMVLAGFGLWLWTVRLFHRIGKGTLAPWDPTSKLVVEGPYRYVRNPMITAVGSLLVGEAIFFGSPWILAWAAFFIGINFAFFLLGEEPGLERRFGDEYRAYKRSVPRWIPRRTFWRPNSEDRGGRYFGHQGGSQRKP